MRTLSRLRRAGIIHYEGKGYVCHPNLGRFTHAGHRSLKRNTPIPPAIKRHLRAHLRRLREKESTPAQLQQRLGSIAAPRGSWLEAMGMEIKAALGRYRSKQARNLK